MPGGTAADVSKASVIGYTAVAPPSSHRWYIQQHSAEGAAASPGSGVHLCHLIQTACLCMATEEKHAGPRVDTVQKQLLYFAHSGLASTCKAV